jgi:hypothetical protein
VAPGPPADAFTTSVPVIAVGSFGSAANEVNRAIDAQVCLAGIVGLLGASLAEAATSG